MAGYAPGTHNFGSGGYIVGPDGLWYEPGTQPGGGGTSGYVPNAYGYGHALPGYTGSEWSGEGSGDVNSSGVGQADPGALAYMQQQGWTPVQWSDGQNTFYGMTDRNGQLVPGSEQHISNGNDSTFWTGAMLAGGVVGGAAAGAFSGGGAAASGAGGGAGAGSGLSAGAYGAAGSLGEAGALVGSGGALTGAYGGAAGLGGAGVAGAGAGGAGFGAAGAGTAGAGGAGGLFGGVSNSTWAQLGSSLGGSLISANQIGKASDAANQATQQSIAANQQAQDKALAAQAPWLNNGGAAVNKLSQLLGLGGDKSASDYGSLNQQFSFDASKLAQTPGYQFQLQEGQNALDRKAAAGGGFYSGGALKDAARFTQGLADTTYGQEYARQSGQFQTNRANVLNPLQSLAGQGQSAANNAGNINIGGANSLATLLTGNANSQGAAAIAQGNALNNGINNGVTAWQRADLMKLYGVGG